MHKCMQGCMHKCMCYLFCCYLWHINDKKEAPTDVMKLLSCCAWLQNCDIFLFFTFGQQCCNRRQKPILELKSEHFDSFDSFSVQRFPSLVRPQSNPPPWHQSTGNQGFIRMINTFSFPVNNQILPRGTASYWSFSNPSQQRQSWKGQDQTVRFHVTCFYWYQLKH